MDLIFYILFFLNFLNIVIACFGGGLGLASLGGCAPYGLPLIGERGCLPVYPSSQIAIPATYGKLKKQNFYFHIF